MAVWPDNRAFGLGFFLAILIGIPGLAGTGEDITATPGLMEVVLTGHVRRAVIGGVVGEGIVEVRLPGGDDQFVPVTSDIGEGGTYELRFVPGALGKDLEKLTVSVISAGFTVEEESIAQEILRNGGTATVDFSLSAATIDGVLDIFSCCVLSWAIVIVMLPAFFLGAAVKAFVPNHLFLRYLGPQAPKPVSYGAAVGSGMVLSLCSCNVVPLFLSVWRGGAGIGPAFAFLFAGPAINVVSMVFACRVIGLGIGIWRVISVAVMSLIVGAVMACVFGRKQSEDSPDAMAEAMGDDTPVGPALTLAALLLAILVVGSIEMGIGLRALITLPLVAAVSAIAYYWLDRDQCVVWLRETRGLVLRVIPILVPAVLAIGFVAQKVPLTATRWMSGSSGVVANGGASLLGALMYFPIMTETAFTKALLKVMGISTGPAMAILLTAPGLSLPGMVIVGREIGIRKLLTYVVVLVCLATVFGVFFGSSWGGYLCNCEYK
ncbi:MAG: hypothetical protein HN742_27425 [Lentisphaerae bacterium]|jgi:uncharacterized protein|nr:hypothetical protein [Lentisphaerota bacterium]MBT5607962.1 hypothetical protein [Lentisphaerota bacterium]MBT7845635.1 hypothetical protein [Lentisphaerota bacterium]